MLRHFFPGSNVLPLNYASNCNWARKSSSRYLWVKKFRTASAYSVSFGNYMS